MPDRTKVNKHDRNRIKDNTLVYIHKPFLYKHSHDAIISDAYRYLINSGKDPDEWNIISLAVFDVWLEEGIITPEDPVHFITKNITDHD